MPRPFAYPVAVTRDRGDFIAEFPDVPEAHTQAASHLEALAESVDALIAALGGYIEARRDLPRPSPARGRATVALPPLPAAKLALYQAMRDAGATNVALAKRLGVAENAVRRLLDLDHRSHIGQVAEALALFDKRLTVTVDDVEAATKRERIVVPRRRAAQGTRRAAG